MQTDQDNKVTNFTNLHKGKVLFTIASAPCLELSTNCISSEFDKSINNAIEKATRYKKLASLILVLVAVIACVGIFLTLLHT